MSESFPASQLSVYWPLIVLAMVVLPVCAIAWRWQAYPTWRWLPLMGFALLLSLLAFIDVALLAMLVGGFAVFSLSILFFDLIVLLRTTATGISVERSMMRTASLGKELISELTIENRSGGVLRGWVRDDLPPKFMVSPKSHRLQLNPRSMVTMRRKLVPMQRGQFELNQAYLKLDSPLGFWICMRSFPVSSTLNVFPDMKQLSDYALLARTNRLSLIGVRRTRQIGQDSDFERLRDYTPDDNYRHIDWRSTAKRRKLTVRQFQSDQSQRVIFLIDCGRMMTNEREGLTLLDHSINSMLMMAYVALHQGDDVGLLCFSDRIHRYLPPQGGSSQMNRLLQATFDQFPRMVESRYDEAFLYLSNHCKRRSLVVLVTSVIDEVNAAQVKSYLGNIGSRHLPLAVLLRDRQMFEAADNPDGEPINLYRSAAAADILLWRHQVLTDLEKRGVLLVDAFPDELTAPLVNQYLQVKAKHLL